METQLNYYSQDFTWSMWRVHCRFKYIISLLLLFTIIIIIIILLVFIIIIVILIIIVVIMVVPLSPFKRQAFLLIRFYSVLFYSILFYSTLFYSIGVVATCYYMQNLESRAWNLKSRMYTLQTLLVIYEYTYIYIYIHFINKYSSFKIVLARYSTMKNGPALKIWHSPILDWCCVADICGRAVLPHSF